MKYFLRQQNIYGLKYVITKKRMAKPAKAAFIHYAGFLEDGHLLIQV
jgi:hypothetical protein